MLRGLRKKANPQTKDSDERRLPFVNADGGAREDGIRADRDYQASLEFLKAEPPSPVKKIADKLGAIPPALQLITDTKDPSQKHLATQDLAFKADAVQSAVHSYLSSRWAAIEEEEGKKSKAEETK